MRSLITSPLAPTHEAGHGVAFISPVIMANRSTETVQDTGNTEKL